MVIALTFGAAIYSTPVHAHHDEVSAQAMPATLNIVTGAREPIIATDTPASPVRFHACFTTLMRQAMLTETYRDHANATPLTAPDGFACLDAGRIDRAPETGEAIAFLDTGNIHDRVDRVIAVFPDRRAHAWQHLNEKYAE